MPCLETVVPRLCPGLPQKLAPPLPVDPPQAETPATGLVQTRRQRNLVSGCLQNAPRQSLLRYKRVTRGAELTTGPL